MSGNLQFGELVPETTAAFVREAWLQAQSEGKAMSPMEFMDRFESTLSAPVVDLATRLRGEAIPFEEMESAGSISDFDQQWGASENGVPHEESRPRKAAEFRPHGVSRDGVPWVVWAAAALVILTFGVWFWLDQPLSTRVQRKLTTSAGTEGPSTSSRPSAEAVAPPAFTAGSATSKDAAIPQPAEKLVVKKEEPKVQPVKSGVVAASKPVENAPTTMPNAAKVAPSATAPVPQPAEKDPVTIRKAILPTPEELEKMKQGQVQRKIGRLPDQNTASPFVQARN
jgi:hypothetical protein